MKRLHFIHFKEHKKKSLIELRKVLKRKISDIILHKSNYCFCNSFCRIIVFHIHATWSIMLRLAFWNGMYSKTQLARLAHWLNSNQPRPVKRNDKDPKNSIISNSISLTLYRYFDLKKISFFIIVPTTYCPFPLHHHSSLYVRCMLTAQHLWFFTMYRTFILIFQFN